MKVVVSVGLFEVGGNMFQPIAPLPILRRRTAQPRKALVACRRYASSDIISSQPVRSRSQVHGF